FAQHVGQAVAGSLGVFIWRGNSRGHGAAVGVHVYSGRIPASMLSFAFYHGIGMFSQKRIDVQVIPLEGWTNIVSHFENEAILGDTDRAPHRLRPAHFPQCVEHTPFRLTVTQGRSLGEHVLCRAVRADHDIERDFAAEKFEAFTSGDEARLYGLER